ncbi:HD-GYP domain-containing protein [Enterovibrio norvegicus]|uniref:HD-GYP domain-containing protein n=1 Tax=Enterovibrio norvegicus TaxID=188144 RepID=UPI000C8454A8|nr:HD-GYP domain-containing protein [Enterovibrio norvegicus]PMH69678.1 phosphohydrolase [Enterovibrio norvegicus]PMI34661.1 phosphohydrolase [Enterovibrio norvegicus]TKF17672.1 HD-GYP domain-containing protein [Enterovibrio norvegicus]
MLQKVAIDSVEIGMYVEQIESQRTRTRMKKHGFIRKQETIENLRGKGVEYVYIDADQVTTTEDIQYHATPIGKHSSVKGNSEFRVAKDLVDKSKEQLSKLLNDVYANKPVDIEPVKEVSADIVDNIFERREAVLWISGIREKSAYLLEHSMNVAFHLVNFGRYLELDRQTLEELAIGGLVHDIGKILIRDEVLNKPGKLTDDEFVHMKEHQTLSQPVLDNMAELSPTSKDVSLMHHEKIDGNGYPNGLKGEELTLIGRMSGIVDIYDALTAERVYKPALSPSEAFKIMIGLTPFHLDSDLLKRFIRCIGFYPIGSVVELSNGRIGLVCNENPDDLMTPTVKLFYSGRTESFREVEYIDLKKRPDLKIVRGLTEAKLKTSFKEFR